MASILDKVGHGLSAGVQWTKQKIGRSQASEEDEEFKHMMDDLTNTKLEMREMLKQVEKMHEADLTFAINLGLFTKTTSRLGNHCDDCNDSVHSFCKKMDAFDSRRTECRDKFKELIVTPTRELVDGPLSDIQSLRQSYDLAHLDYDRRNEAVAEAQDKSPDKLQSAQSDLQASKEVYDQARKDLRSKYDCIVKARNQILQDNFCEFSKFLDRMMPKESPESESKSHSSDSQQQQQPSHSSSAPSQRKAENISGSSGISAGTYGSSGISGSSDISGSSGHSTRSPATSGVSGHSSGISSGSSAAQPGVSSGSSAAQPGVYGSSGLSGSSAHHAGVSGSSGISGSSGVGSAAGSQPASQMRSQPPSQQH